MHLCFFLLLQYFVELFAHMNLSFLLLDVLSLSEKLSIFWQIVLILPTFLNALFGYLGSRLYMHIVVLAYVFIFQL